MSDPRRTLLQLKPWCLMSRRLNTLRLAVFLLNLLIQEHTHRGMHHAYYVLVVAVSVLVEDLGGLFCYYCAVYLVQMWSSK
jgi:hypothetical protein